MDSVKIRKYNQLRFTLIAGYLAVLIMGLLLKANTFIILAGVIIVLMVQIITKLFMQSKLRK